MVAQGILLNARLGHRLDTNDGMLEEKLRLDWGPVNHTPGMAAGRLALRRPDGGVPAANPRKRTSRERSGA